MVEKEIISRLKKFQQDMLYYASCYKNAESGYNMLFAQTLREEDVDIDSNTICLDCGRIRPVDRNRNDNPPCECKII